MEKWKDDKIEIEERLDSIIKLSDVLGYGLETIYRMEDTTPASCVRSIKAELLRLKKDCF